MNELTEKQEKLLTYIKLINKSKGFQPSVKELADYYGISTTAILHSLKWIEKKGYIKLTGKSRAIEFLKENE